MCWLGFHTKTVLASKRMMLPRLYDFCDDPITEPEDVVVVLELCEDCGKEWAWIVPMIGYRVKINVEFAKSMIYDTAQ